MIVTVTFNPAVDKTAFLPSIRLNGLNRMEDVRWDAGGKGINVSKTLKALGKDSLAAGFLAGHSGRLIEESLKELSVHTRFVWVEGQTRTNLKIINDQGQLTEFNEAGPWIHEKELENLQAVLLEHANPGTVTVLCGNVSPGVPGDIYETLIRAIHEKRGRVILDADGELFEKGIRAHPDVIKPNLEELCQYYKCSSQNLETGQIVSMARGLLEERTFLAVVSMGSRGSLFVTREQVYEAEPMDINVCSSVGAGDAMVAALAYGLEEAFSLPEMAALASAASAGACMTQGTRPAERTMVQELMKNTRIRLLEL